MGRTNLTECGLRYMANTSEAAEWRKLYAWNGPVLGISKNNLTQISLQGCLALCGSGNDYYTWTVSSGTITTWILPSIGVLLQAPFESNATQRTFFTLVRWLGSPISSLSYIFWNIKATGKSALIGKSAFSSFLLFTKLTRHVVDMASKYDEYPARKTDFGSFRDSFYILTVMNQYSMKRSVSIQKEAEGLLRIALFSKDLRLRDTDKTLRQTRRILARELREGRKRGVVPVLASFGWFLFALAISIQSAFGYIGQNVTAHDLAMVLRSLETTEEVRIVRICANSDLGMSSLLVTCPSGSNNHRPQSNCCRFNQEEIKRAR